MQTVEEFLKGWKEKNPVKGNVRYPDGPPPQNGAWPTTVCSDGVIVDRGRFWWPLMRWPPTTNL